jgi:hypothetical protein
MDTHQYASSVRPLTPLSTLKEISERPASYVTSGAVNLEEYYIPVTLYGNLSRDLEEARILFGDHPFNLTQLAVARMQQVWGAPSFGSAGYLEVLHSSTDSTVLREEQEYKVQARVIREFGEDWEEVVAGTETESLFQVLLTQFVSELKAAQKHSAFARHYRFEVHNIEVPVRYIAKDVVSVEYSSSAPSSPKEVLVYVIVGRGEGEEDRAWHDYDFDINMLLRDYEESIPTSRIHTFLVPEKEKDLTALTWKLLKEHNLLPA